VSKQRRPRPERHRHPVNQALVDHATRSERAVDAAVSSLGSLRYISWQTGVVIVWIAVNSLVAFRVLHWDPYPFILLNLLFSTQAAYAAPLILLSQNRQGERDRIKAEHDFSVNEEALGLLKKIAAAQDRPPPGP
jgi:uncharacterized membrane protein